jgi:hypothetical protein
VGVSVGKQSSPLHFFIILYEAKIINTAKSNIKRMFLVTVKAAILKTSSEWQNDVSPS